MASRSAAGQMDWSWDNTSGPVGANPSPFATYRSQDRLNETLSNKKRGSGLNRFHARVRAHKTAGTFSSYDSPQKHDMPPSPSKTPSHLFRNSPTKTGPPDWSVFNSPNFTTPRKFDAESPYSSSGIDTSPENQADNEATPEMGAHQSKALIFKGTDTSAVKPSSARPRSSKGRGEIAHRVGKRKRFQDGGIRLNFLRSRKAEASDSEDDAHEGSRRGGRKQGSGKKNTEKNGAGFVASIFGFIHSHPDLPHILAYYFQLLLNAFLVLSFIYLIYSFWSTIRADVDKKADEATGEIMAEMAACSRDYLSNRCDDPNRAPALESICSNWKRCFSRDPKAIGRARVSAHTFAEILNSFVEPISIKAYAFCFFGILGTMAISNFAFGSMRSRQQSQMPEPQYHQTPSRHAANLNYMDSPWMQQQQQQIIGSPRRGNNMSALGNGSPVRRLQYN